MNKFKTFIFTLSLLLSLSSNHQILFGMDDNAVSMLSNDLEALQKEIEAFKHIGHLKSFFTYYFINNFSDATTYPSEGIAKLIGFKDKYSVDINKMYVQLLHNNNESFNPLDYVNCCSTYENDKGKDCIFCPEHPCEYCQKKLNPYFFSKLFDVLGVNKVRSRENIELSDFLKLIDENHYVVVKILAEIHINPSSNQPSSNPTQPALPDKDVSEDLRKKLETNWNTIAHLKQENAKLRRKAKAKQHIKHLKDCFEHYFKIHYSSRSIYEFPFNMLLSNKHYILTDTIDRIFLKKNIRYDYEKIDCNYYLKGQCKYCEKRFTQDFFQEFFQLIDLNNKSSLELGDLLQFIDENKNKITEKLAAIDVSTKTKKINLIKGKLDIMQQTLEKYRNFIDNKSLGEARAVLDSYSIWVPELKFCLKVLDFMKIDRKLSDSYVLKRDRSNPNNDWLTAANAWLDTRNSAIVDHLLADPDLGYLFAGIPEDDVDEDNDNDFDLAQQPAQVANTTTLTETKPTADVTATLPAQLDQTIIPSSSNSNPQILDQGITQSSVNLGISGQNALVNAPNQNAITNVATQDATNITTTINATENNKEAHQKFQIPRNVKYAIAAMVVYYGWSFVREYFDSSYENFIKSKLKSDLLKTIQEYKSQIGKELLVEYVEIEKSCIEVTAKKIALINKISKRLTQKTAFIQKVKNHFGINEKAETANC